MNAQNNSESSSFINPQAIVDHLELSEGMIVAEFGCGTGYFVFPMAKKVGENGKIYALDILKAKLETVDSQAKILGLTNIETKRVNLEKDGGSKLENEAVDWVVLSNMLCQNKSKEIILNEAKRVLKPSGKMLVIEWNAHPGLMGPEEETRISKEIFMDMAQKNGLQIVKEIPVSSMHYGFILSK